MFKFITSIAAVIIIAGCAGYTPLPVEDPVCPREGSWLCDQSAALGVTLEDTYGWIYTATAGAAIVDIVDRVEVCEFAKEVGSWYESHYPLSYAGLIAEVVSRMQKIDDPEKLQLLSNIINKNLMQYTNTQIISKADDEIIRIGYDAFITDMYCAD